MRNMFAKPLRERAQPDALVTAYSLKNRLWRAVAASRRGYTSIGMSCWQQVDTHFMIDGWLRRVKNKCS